MPNVVNESSRKHLKERSPEVMALYHRKLNLLPYEGRKVELNTLEVSPDGKRYYIKEKPGVRDSNDYLAKNGINREMTETDLAKEMYEFRKQRAWENVEFLRRRDIKVYKEALAAYHHEYTSNTKTEEEEKTNKRRKKTKANPKTNKKPARTVAKINPETGEYCPLWVFKVAGGRYRVRRIKNCTPVYDNYFSTREEAERASIEYQRELFGPESEFNKGA